MILAQQIITIILMVGGLFFLTVSAVGLLRFPDFYSRLHAVGKSETLGAILLLAGLAVYNGWALSTMKIMLILFFVMMANPTATHAIAQTALHSGLQPWTRKKKKTKQEDKDDV